MASVAALIMVASQARAANPVVELSGRIEPTGADGARIVAIVSVAKGYHVNAHRIAAHAVAGLIAALGGILLTWYNSLVTPGVVGVTAMINVLIISVLGGLGHPVAAFLGALVFVLLQNFAIDLVDRERFNLVIGCIFLLIVLFSPDGLLGLWRRQGRRLLDAGTRRGP